MSDLTMIPPWEEVLRDYIAPGLPHWLVVRNAPGLHVFTDMSGARLGGRFELPATARAAPATTLEQITVSDVSANGRRWLEIATATPRLYESFYRLITQVAGAVLSGATPYVALEQAVGLWDDLVEQAAVLSEERQAGLFGELLFLERLLLNGTDDPIAAWVGPDRQPHDFRIGTREFEVKTTSGTKRVHTINGLGQLQPSLDCTLYLVSMQITDAGTGGQSLPELIDHLKTILPADRLIHYNQRLVASGYVARHAPHYTRKRRLRSNIVMNLVEDGVPRLTAAALSALPLGFTAGRIGAVTYDIDVSGLGFEDGSEQFSAIIPPAAAA